MFYTIYDVLLFEIKRSGIEEKEIEKLLKEHGIMAKQLELLRSNCIELIPENILDKVLKISGLSKLEMNLMLGNVPKEYEESYWENISAIAQLLTARESVKDNKKANVEFKTAKGELYHADCLEILPLIQSESVDLIFADPPFN